MIARQLSQSMQGLQRLRQGEDVPAPPNVQISHDIKTTSDEARDYRAHSNLEPCTPS